MRSSRSACGGKVNAHAPEASLTREGSIGSIDSVGSLAWSSVIALLPTVAGQRRP